jgi:hypothetical protein
MLPQVEAKRLALEKEVAYQEASRDTSATGYRGSGARLRFALGERR